MIKILIDIIYRIFFKSDKRQRWYNDPSSEAFAEKIPSSDIPEEVAPEKVRINFPVLIKGVTSRFGWRKIPGIPRHFHRGTDYTSKGNEYTLAPCKCIVKKIQYPDHVYPHRFKYENGKWNKIDVPKGRAWTPYVVLVACHDKNIKFVHRHGKAVVVLGQVLEEGDPVTKVGGYGYSQGAHHHDEYLLRKRKKFKNIDPDKQYRKHEKEM